MDRNLVTQTLCFAPMVLELPQSPIGVSVRLFDLRIGPGKPCDGHLNATQPHCAPKFSKSLEYPFGTAPRRILQVDHAVVGFDIEADHDRDGNGCPFGSSTGVGETIERLNAGRIDI